MNSVNCNSCNYSFTKGRGLCSDWFCSERCREWYDDGNPPYKSSSTGSGEWKVVAGPPELPVGSTYKYDFRNPSINLTLDDVGISLEIPTKAIKKDYLEGKNGRVLVRPDGRNFYLELTVSRRQTSAFKEKLSFMYEEDGKFFLYRLPTKTETEAIRSAVGIRKKINFTPEFLGRLKNNLPTPVETP